MTPDTFNPRNRLEAYWRLMRLDRPIGTLLLLWPTLWGLWMAGGGHPRIANLAIFMIGTLLMRSAGCVMNDLADRKIDRQVTRTHNRPLASGEVSPREAVILALAVSFVAFLLVLTRNPLTVLLSLPALFLAGSYPLTKRFFPLPQAYLGIAFSFGIPMAFAAETGQIPDTAWLLMLANFFWTIAYDTEYAMVDRDDDIHLGIHSSALLFGRADILAVMICYLLSLATLAGIGWAQGFGLAYHLGLLAGALIAFYHTRLIRHRDRESCFKAFLHNNWFGAVIFVGIVLDYLSR